MGYKSALKAVAGLAHVDIPSSVQVVRRNALFDEEIPIEEELINLQEAVASYHSANSLQEYPGVREHIDQEKRLILKHCFGLVVRMLYRKRLPRHYDQKDTEFAIRRLVQLVVEDTYRQGKKIDISALERVWPLLNWRQRFTLNRHGMSVRGRHLAAGN